MRLAATSLIALTAVAALACTHRDRDGQIEQIIPDAAFATSPPMQPTPTPFGLTDLTVDPDLITSSLSFDTILFTPSDCAMVEGCIVTPGDRTVMRFSVASINNGPDDLYLGDPDDRPELFEYSPCHDHVHLTGFAKYSLVDGNGTEVGVGHKQAFCLMDIFPYAPVPSKGYDCQNQGITAGWADIYDSQLDCQWIDVTDVAPGTYDLVVSIDDIGLFAETDETNNIVTVPVTVP